MFFYFKKYHRFIFYLLWLVITLVQAGNTELFDDEAYYWVYTKFPAWGYFDHPPMISWLISAGYSVVKSEFGVRILIVFLNVCTIGVIEAMLRKKDPFLFYAICCSIAIVQIGGMIAVPDLPLLFFTSLFFYTYQQYEEKRTIWLAIALGVIISLMLYSKYHAVLIILFTLLSNVKLFRRAEIYLAALVALLLFAPHLYWQYQHDFPSVQFHLFERNASSYKISFTLDYIAGQLLIAGPVIGWLLLWAAFKYQWMDPMERAVKFSMIGFYIFFLISSFKGRVEANWTIPCMIGIIILSHQYLHNKRLSKWIYRTVPVTLFLVLVVRVYMMLDIPANAWAKKDEFHGNKNWVTYLKKHAAGNPVVFINSYQKPSKMWFYGNSFSFSLNTPIYRRNNFNYWPIEDSLFGKTVLVTGLYDSAILKTRVGHPEFNRAGMRMISNFYSFSKIRLKKIKIKNVNNQLQFDFQIVAPAHYLQFFQTSPADTAHIQLAVLKNDSTQYFPSTFAVSNIRTVHTNASMAIPDFAGPGKYKGRLAISSAVPGHPSLNSSWFDITIE